MRQIGILLLCCISLLSSGAQTVPNLYLSLIHISSTEKGGEVEVRGEAIPGQTVEIIEMPKPGYAFEGWYLDGVFIPDAEMSHEILIGKDMGKLEAKFRELPVDLEVEGGENGWAEVTRYRGDVINLKAEPIVDHTFMGWYLLDQLLSRCV